MRERIISFFVVSAFAGPVGAMELAEFAAGESLFMGLIGGTVAAWMTSQSPRHRDAVSDRAAPSAPFLELRRGLPAGARVGGSVAASLGGDHGGPAKNEKDGNP